MSKPDWSELLSIQSFLAEEARLLDEGCWSAWQSLLTEDAHYWVTTSAQQTDPVSTPSLAYEDRLLIQIRIDRLNHPQAHSQKPPSRSQHVMQAPQIIERQNDSGHVVITTRSAFHYTEQRGTQQVCLTGMARHTLVSGDDGWRIQLKRIDLLTADAAIPMVQLFL